MKTFIVDEMLGKLAKWLRLLGYDTIYQTPTSDSAIVRQALKEKRIILTRDTRMVAQKQIPRYLLIKSDNLMLQLKQVIDELDLRLDSKLYFSRCLLCNTEIQPIKKEEVKNRVPEYTYKTQEEFLYCPLCDKIYWSGSHIQKVQQKLEELG